MLVRPVQEDECECPVDGRDWQDRLEENDCVQYSKETCKAECWVPHGFLEHLMSLALTDLGCAVFYFFFKRPDAEHVEEVKWIQGVHQRRDGQLADEDEPDVIQDGSLAPHWNFRVHDDKVGDYND